MTPERAGPETDWAGLLDLIRAEFAFMEGRIDPPSSMHALTAAAIAEQAAAGEVWMIADQGRPVACVFLTVKPGCLYLGKLAVAGSHRGRGLARQLVETAAERARALGLRALELQTRVELIENHATFRALGFQAVGATAHKGYSRPTSLTFRMVVQPE